MSTQIWGRITWILFHSLAAKIKPEHFDNERVNLITHIREVCRVLPCPNCAMHAIQNLSNIDNVATKEQLRHFLFNFHNVVNARKNITIPDISIIEQYKTTDLNRVIQAWINNFRTESGITKFMNLSVMRNKTKENFINYLKTNFHKFS